MTFVSLTKLLGLLALACCFLFSSLVPCNAAVSVRHPSDDQAATEDKTTDGTFLPQRSSENGHSNEALTAFAIRKSHENAVGKSDDFARPPAALRKDDETEQSIVQVVKAAQTSIVKVEVYVRLYMTSSFFSEFTTLLLDKPKPPAKWCSWLFGNRKKEPTSFLVKVAGASGHLWNDGGYIVTNDHVVSSNALELKVADDGPLDPYLKRYGIRFRGAKAIDDSHLEYKVKITGVKHLRWLNATLVGRDSSRFV